MELHPAVVVHSLADARRALAAARSAGRGVTLLSAPGAGLYAGCLWWRDLVAIARAEFPDVPTLDVLDCADGTARAWAAMRVGVTRLVLSEGAPGREALRSALTSVGGYLLVRRPPLL